MKYVFAPEIFRRIGGTDREVERTTVSRFHPFAFLNPQPCKILP